MRLHQRQQMERRSKYHFQRLRPEIYRIPENKMQHKKDCDCKSCKKYYAALIEAAAAFQKEEKEKQERKIKNENNSNSSILNSNKANRPVTQDGNEDVRAGADSKADAEPSSITSDSNGTELSASTNSDCVFA